MYQGVKLTSTPLANVVSWVSIGTRSRSSYVSATSPWLVVQRRTEKKNQGNSGRLLLTQGQGQTIIEGLRDWITVD